MPERKSFSVGVLDGNHDFRRRAEDKLAACFGLPNRRGVNKVKLYEAFWAEVADCDVRVLRQAIAMIRGGEAK